MTRSLSLAVARRPFSNGTEGGAWTATWCDHCARDHGMHNNGDGPGCSIVLDSMVNTDRHPPEVWLPEPDDGKFYLPPRIVCLAFTPCDDCGGDPGAEERAERVAEVSAYWQATS